MEINFSFKKSVNQNAGIYFDKAKKAKKKLEGAKKALLDTRKKLADLEGKEEKFISEEKRKEDKKTRKKEWYDKFHWFISSEDFLCFGGKDATTNEIVIKKHLENKDLVFHTEAAGSPFFIIRNGSEAGEKTIKECGQAVASYSKAWKGGFSSTEVFYVKPDQVSKEANPGEFIGKGGFMIRGDRTFLRSKLEYAFGLVEGEIISGPVDAVAFRTKNYVKVVPGRRKKNELAKKIKAKLKGGDTEDLVRFLPGPGEIKK